MSAVILAHGPGECAHGSVPITENGKHNYNCGFQGSSEIYDGSHCFV